MAKHKRYSASKCPEPLNSMIDIAGAVTMGLVSRSIAKNDIKKGRGRESVNAARAVFGMGSLRHGSDGLISLGGLMGVESAVRSAEKEAHRQHSAIEEDPLITDLERRIQATQTIHYKPDTMVNATPAQREKNKSSEEKSSKILCEDNSPEEAIFIYCRISRLDNGTNEYYLAEHECPIGSMVQVEKDDGVAAGIVLTVEKHTAKTAPVSPELSRKIIED